MIWIASLLGRCMAEQEHFIPMTFSTYSPVIQESAGINQA
jgi:hypothetical protein